MTEVRVEDAVKRLQAALQALQGAGTLEGQGESGNHTRLWQEVQALEKRGAAAVAQAGEMLLEPECRRLIQLLTGAEPHIPARKLALPLAHLGRARESTASLVLHHLRHWQSSSLKEPETELFLAIGQCGAARAFEVLLEAKVYGDARVREAVAAGLGALPPAHPAFGEARLVLADLLLHDRESAVRHAAAEALKAYFSDRDQPALLRLSLETDPALRALLKTLWARKSQAAPPGASHPRVASTLASAAQKGTNPDRILKYYVRQLTPGAPVAFFKEFEVSGAPLAAEGREDREPIEPFFSARSKTPDGRSLYTLYDGTLMVEHPEGAISFSVGRSDWRTRNSHTGVVTIRVPVERPFEPRGTLTWRPDGSLRFKQEDGGIEEEFPDGRRIVISPMGVVQVISPRSDQGIQTDVHWELLEKQTAHSYVIIEQANGDLELFGGTSSPAPLTEGVARAQRLPFGALRQEHRDGRVTRDVVKGESTHELMGGRSVSFVPRRGPHPVLGLKTFSPNGEISVHYQDGTQVTLGDGERPRYRLPDGEWVG